MAPASMALPGTGKSFDEFRANDAECRQYASSQIGTTPNDAAVDSAVGSAAVGTAVGALGRCAGRRAHRRRRRSGYRTGGRCDCRRRQQPLCRAHDAAALRFQLPAVHVCPRQQGPGSGAFRSAAAGVWSAAGIRTAGIRTASSPSGLRAATARRILPAASAAAALKRGAASGREFRFMRWAPRIIPHPFAERGAPHVHAIDGYPG